MKPDNHNRHRLQKVTPGFSVSKRPSKSRIIDASAKVRMERDDIVANRPEVPSVHVTTEYGGVGVVYVGPSVEGGDKEYVKVLTGEVDWRKPSFV